MTKSGFILLLSSFLGLNAIAQDEKPTTVSPSRDMIMIQLHYDNWAQMPDSIKFGGVNRGFNMYFMYDFPIGKSNFSFAPGVGFGTYNYYFNDQRAVINEGNDQITFVNYAGGDSSAYKKSKLTLGYFEAPFEFRYYGNKLDRNKGFKAAAGLKVGYLLSTHTKDRVAVGGKVITQKFKTNQYTNQWSFSPTLRLGYGNFSVFGQYNLSTLFKPALGPEVFPWSVGITISGM